MRVTVASAPPYPSGLLIKVCPVRLSHCPSLTAHLSAAGPTLRWAGGDVWYPTGTGVGGALTYPPAFEKSAGGGEQHREVGRCKPVLGG